MAVMNVRAAITVILGLVFQLAQVLPSAALNTPCTPVASTCECCHSGSACECASCGDSERHQTPNPPTEVRSELKAPDMSPTETGVYVVHEKDEVCPAVIQPRLTPDSTGVYPGVRFAVAFCSFLV